MEPLGWLIALAVFLVLEIITLGLTTIWFAGGCLVAAIAGFLQAPLWIQIVLFLVVSLVLLIFTRPVVEKHLNNNREKTNIDGLIGKQGKVIEEIDSLNQTGRVMLNGMEWSAKSRDGEQKIPVEAQVQVVEVKGVHLIVDAVEKNEKGN